MKRYTTITLGCKVNQCESSAIGKQLEAAGLEKEQTQGTSDVVIINTCTVTGKAAMQSRQTIRQAVRKYPQAKIIIAGCYAQTAPDEIKAIEGVDLIVGHNDKMRIAELLSTHASLLNPPDPGCPKELWGAFAALPSVACDERTRAFLKIQDGCNTHCTYCIVPYARGYSRSMPATDVMDHLRQLGSEGFHEVVLTGIHLGAYGADLQPPTNLVDLLASMTDLRPLDRLRISSIEPAEVDRRIIDLVADAQGFLCRHFHVPLQSGDNNVLRRMGRPYTCEDFARVIDDVYHRIPGVAIGVDVIAGFPGESEEAFTRTYQLIETLPVSYLHVFPFSPRKGTPAAAFKDKVPDRTTKERCRRLRSLGEQKRKAFYQSMIGERLVVLIEKSVEGLAKGFSDNYVPVRMPDADLGKNSLVTVRIDRIDVDGCAAGTII